MKSINITEVDNGFVLHLADANDDIGTVETRVGHTSNHVAEIVYGFLSPKEEKCEDAREEECSVAKATDVASADEVTERFGYMSLDMAIRSSSCDAPPNAVIERAQAFKGFLSGKA